MEVKLIDFIRELNPKQKDSFDRWHKAIKEQGELQERERILKLIDKFDKEWSEGLHTDIVCVVLKELKKEVDKNG